MSTFTSTETGADDRRQPDAADALPARGSGRRGQRREDRRLERWMETTRNLVTAAAQLVTGVREIDGAPRRPPVFEPLPVQELPRLRFVGEPSMTFFAPPQAGAVAHHAGSAPVTPAVLPS